MSSTRGTRSPSFTARLVPVLGACAGILVVQQLGARSADAVLLDDLLFVVSAALAAACCVAAARRRRGLDQLIWRLMAWGMLAHLAADLLWLGSDLVPGSALGPVRSAPFLLAALSSAGAAALLLAPGPSRAGRLLGVLDAAAVLLSSSVAVVLAWHLAPGGNAGSLVSLGDLDATACLAGWLIAPGMLSSVLLRHRFRSEPALLVLGAAWVSEGVGSLLLREASTPQMVTGRADPWLLGLCLLIAIGGALSTTRGPAAGGRDHAVPRFDTARAAVAGTASARLPALVAGGFIAFAGCLEVLDPAGRDLLVALPTSLALLGLLAARHVVSERLARRQLESYRRQAETDPLTGISSRTLLAERAAAILRWSAANDRPVTVLVLDVDAFKQVNDRYGHAVGDLALVAVAGAVQGALRPQDQLGRWGGDELVAVLPDAGASAAAAIAGRIQRAVATTTVSPAHPELRMSISVGTATGPPGPGGLELADLLEAADRCLYRAKAARGRRHTRRDTLAADTLAAAPGRDGSVAPGEVLTLSLEGEQA